MSDRKIFVIDTNVILHTSNALEAFGNNEIIIPMTVLEELDKFKSEANELGYNARKAIRMMDDLRSQGSLRSGVTTKHGGHLRVVTEECIKWPHGLSMGIMDNHIIATAYTMLKENEGRDVVFVSQDTSARLKADALDIPVESFQSQDVDITQLYAGWREVDLGPKLFDLLYKNKMVTTKRAKWMNDVHPNERLLIRNRASHNAKALAFVRNPNDKQIFLINNPNQRIAGIIGKNLEQKMAISMLVDPTIKLVTLVGQAGTGKTLLGLAACMSMLHKQVKFPDKVGPYEKIVVSRPIVPIGKDLGFLPGTKEEKLDVWMHPIYDNLKLLSNYQNKDPKSMVEHGILELEALTYIRGRSISNALIIVDEAQNMTPHEVKTVISRCGHNSKVILTGDPYQIDSPYLDASSNGLTYAVEALKHSDITGHMTLTKTERSELSALATKLL